MTDQVEKEMYRSNIVQQIISGEISWQRQRKEKILGTLEIVYLAEMNRFELVSEGNGKKKYTQKRENFPLFDIKKYCKRQECVGECRKIQAKQKKINVNILYVKCST